MKGVDEALRNPWGDPPWEPIRVEAPRGWPREERVDACVVGGGFTGLSAALHLLRLRPDWRVVVLESEALGAGASGRSGGIVLEGTATGPAPGFEGCVEGLVSVMDEEGIDAGWESLGSWEVAREGGGPSPIAWNDFGTLRVVRQVPGGAVEPARLVDGLARAVVRRGGSLHVGAPVARLEGEDPAVVVGVGGERLTAKRVVLAGGALMIPLMGLEGEVQPFHTLALATEPLAAGVVRALGWESRTPFYTVELPYLWGRLNRDGRAVIGAGIVPLGAAKSLEDDDPRSQLESLEERVRGLVPEMKGVRVTHRWAGPIGLTTDGKPRLIDRGARGRVVGAAGYSGHGVAMGVRIGKILAEAAAAGQPLPGPRPRFGRPVPA